jgi:nitrite reductase (cytochrome c-552)
MALRVSRPAFIEGMKAWKASEGVADYDVNTMATRQEMRTYVCGQCHVEYYCGPKTTLFFPWNKGLGVDEIESYYATYTFPDGSHFYDWKHKITGAEVIKVQHPEFELWSQGIHARSGVACADCHMPYIREGAVKISDHHVRSPLLNVSKSCQVCHNVPEQELRERVFNIQDKTKYLMDRALDAVVALIGDIEKAQLAGATDAQLKEARELQRKAQYRVDFVNAENSMGFHAPQEAARMLGDAIDMARQGQLSITRITPVQKASTNP